MTNARIEIRMRVPDRTPQRHDRSMNWKCVRSWYRSANVWRFRSTGGDAVVAVTW
jgi:hypothetical protein